MILNRIPLNKAWNTVEYSDTLCFSSDISTNLENCQRMGIMATFRSFHQFELYFDSLMEFFSPQQTDDLDELAASPDRLCNSLTIGSPFIDRINNESKVGIRVTAGGLQDVVVVW